MIFFRKYNTEDQIKYIMYYYNWLLYFSNQLTKANFFAMQPILEYSMFDGINSAS